MCGIIGCIDGTRGSAEENINQGKVSKLLYKGLKKLEYRGYDSAGISVLSNPSMKVKKGSGRIDEVNEHKNFLDLNGNVGIGHTRWATHGAVNDINAHPHTSCDQKVTVVHNGIIENYEELKKELENKGHTFTTQTDSEVIPHLIEDLYEETGNLFESAKKVDNKLKGSYAVLIMHIDEPDKIVAIRKDSPLVIGKGDKQNFLASDAPAFIDKTKKAIFLQDHDIAQVTENNIKIYNSKENKIVNRKTKELEWDPEEASKEGHKHFMLKEILEQSEVAKKSLMNQKSKLKKARKKIKKAKNIYFVACGTSRHAGLTGEYLFANNGIKSQAILANEFEYISNKVTEDDLIIAISQSGETADLLMGLKEMKTNPEIISIVNVKGSTLTRKSDLNIYINAGPEIGVASTKAFTNQLMVINLLSKLNHMTVEESKKHLTDIPDKINQTINKNKELIKKLSDKIKNKKSIFYLGRGKYYPIALEGALKLKEISYLHAEGLAGGELKHGTLSLVEKGTPIVAIAPSGKEFEDIKSNLEEVKSRGGEIITVSDRKDIANDHLIEIPESNAPDILSIIPLQLLAYYTAVKKGNNPDKPRNLAKSVTVQ